MELRQQDRVIVVKIVYYGPAVGGKTTNLQKLHLAAGAERRGDLLSVDSAQDRTILFDLLPLATAGYKGFEVRLRLVAVPGQAMYAATRRLVLRGADGVVFVANSAADRWEDNILSFKEMKRHLIDQHLDPETIPFVLQYNKRDLPVTTSMSELDIGLNARGVPVFPGVATRGEGVLETFSAILGATMVDLAARHPTLAPEPGHSLEEWTRQTVLGMFGRPTLAPPPGHPLPPLPDAAEPEALFRDSVKPVTDETPRQREFKIPLPAEALKMSGSGPDDRANESLVEIYAKAAETLALQLDDMRAERDKARFWVDDLWQTMLATESIALGEPPEKALRGVLGRVMRGTGCRVASALVGLGDETGIQVCLGMAKDPILTHPAGAEYIRSRLLSASEPSLALGRNDPVLADLFAVCTPPFGALASVRLNGDTSADGLFLLYFREGASLPGPDVLTYIGDLARRLAVALECQRAVLATARQSAAAPGASARRGLRAIEPALQSVSERLQGLAVSDVVAPVVAKQLASAGTTLADVRRGVRAVLDFGDGVVQRQPVDVTALLENWGAAGLSRTLEPGLGVVSGDRWLLSMALDAAADIARGASGADRAVPLSLRASGDDSTVTITLSAPTIAEAGDTLVEQGLLHRIAQQHGGEFRMASDADRLALTLRLSRRGQPAR